MLLKVCTRFVLKNHLTATYQYIRAVNSSSTGCTNIHRGLCKILWYCSILFSVNCELKKKYFYWFKYILQSVNLSLLTDLSELWFIQRWEIHGQAFVVWDKLLLRNFIWFQDQNKRLIISSTQHNQITKIFHVVTNIREILEVWVKTNISKNTLFL